MEPFHAGGGGGGSNVTNLQHKTHCNAQGFQDSTRANIKIQAKRQYRHLILGIWQRPNASHDTAPFS